MTPPETYEPRLATPGDADEVARLLHDFNTEYAWPSPGADVLTPRLRNLLGGISTYAVIAGRPAVAVALVTVRPNVWYEGPVALLDELYVVPSLRGQGIGTTVLDLVTAHARERHVALVEVNVDEGDVDAQRFYVRHGFSMIEPETGERAFYLHQEIGD
ncbi:GNAT family N-acetyltransferase [Mumia zhuanghuii]|uniref:GNAT family N-acetyltransferase n=2 Tax=Mumia TaxID=1546255 RepID=A0ABW1QH15_9ACTN|nr:MULTISPECIES: GNAT family N-acetyltransferase [Mumia]KAA1422764.1 GNAT family N-acetyltransferase [Mumia zhuanghuii]